jgi:hypothetical protein
MIIIIPVPVVAASVVPSFLGALRAATPTIETPITITTNETIWWVYCFLPRNYHAR